jgi:hypothetical protein
MKYIKSEEEEETSIFRRASAGGLIDWWEIVKDPDDPEPCETRFRERAERGRFIKKFSVRSQDECCVCLVNVYPEALICFDGPEKDLVEVLNHHRFQPTRIQCKEGVELWAFYPESSVNDFELCLALMRWNGVPSKQIS